MEDATTVSAAGVAFAVEGAVATITLARPESLNAQTPRMWEAIADFLDGLGPHVRVVVVHAEGRAFSAGLDLSLLDADKVDEPGNLVATMSGSDTEVADRIGEYQRPFVMLRDPRFVSIAVIEGPAIGAGFQLALSCDIRIATTAAWFSMREAALGLVPDLTGTKTLVDLVGYSNALEICGSTRKIEVAEAERLGIVQKLVGPEDVHAEVERLVASFVNTDAAAVRAIKELLQAADSRSLDEQRLAERTAQVQMFRSVLTPGRQ